MKILKHLHDLLDSLESKLGRRTKGHDYAFMNCSIRVNTLQSGWERTVRGFLKSWRGIRSSRMNEYGLVQVSGIADPKELLGSLEKMGRRAELVQLQYGQCSENLFGPTLMNINGGPPHHPRLPYSYYDRRMLYNSAHEDDETWSPLSGADVTCCSLM